MLRETRWAVGFGRVERDFLGVEMKENVDRGDGDDDVIEGKEGGIGEKFAVPEDVSRTNTIYNVNRDIPVAGRGSFCS